MAVNKRRIYLRQRGQEKHPRAELVGQCVSAAAAFASLGLCLRDLMYNSLVLSIYLAVGCAVILLCLGAERIAVVKKYMGMGLYVVTLLVLVVGVVPAFRGFLDGVNRLITLWNLRFETEAIGFSVAGNLAVGSAVFWGLLAVPISVGILSLVRHRRVASLTLALLAGVLFGFLLGQYSMVGGSMLSLIALLANQIGSQAPHRRLEIRGVGLLCATLLLAGGVSWLFRGYNGSTTLADWRKSVQSQVAGMRYGADTLPEGDLTRAAGLLDGDEVTLKVTMEQPQALYLRGFVGSVYTGSAWKRLDIQDYLGDYEGILDWLDQEGLSPVTQYASYAALSGLEVWQTISVRNLGANRRYVYMPYSADGTSLESFAQPEKDWQVQAKGIFGARLYDFVDVVDAPTAEQVEIGSWLQSPATDSQETYIQAESVYRSFVEEKYMQIDPDVEKVIDQVFFSGDDWDGQTDFSSVTSRIRRVLRDETHYTAKPATVPGGEDFITWFLTEEKSGNAVYYATAAVMAYRAAGYPARYVEGYHLSLKSAQLMKLLDEDEATLTNQNAHAWVEVYVSGAGWMPVEVVPGMYVENYTSQLVEGKPLYSVSAMTDSEEGLDVTESESAGDGTEREPETEDDKEPLLLAGVLLVLYVVFFLYLILEIQRWLRIQRRRRLARSLDDETLSTAYAQLLMKTLRCGGVTGNYNHPLELTEQVAVRFPGVGSWAYERSVSLVQKVRFGCQGLTPHERHAMSEMLYFMQHTLYNGASPLRRLRLRYQYAVEK